MKMWARISANHQARILRHRHRHAIQFALIVLSGHPVNSQLIFPGYQNQVALARRHNATEPFLPTT